MRASWCSPEALTGGFQTPSRARGPIHEATLKRSPQRRLVHIPMGRFGEAREIAQAALFLASDESPTSRGRILE